MDEAQSPPGLKIRWGALSIGLAVFAAACLGTLVVVATVRAADMLSTVALALAVVAFSAQLIVSLAQANSNAQQLVQTERVNTNTQATLVEIRATSSSLLSNQRDLFGDVLQAALQDKIPSVAEEVAAETSTSTTDETSSEQFADRIQSALDRAISGINREDFSTRVGKNRLSRHPLYYELNKEPTQTEAEHALEVLNSMSPYQALRFGNYAQKFLTLATQGREPRLRFVRRVDAEQGRLTRLFEELGLFDVSERIEGESVRITAVLTKFGIDVARIATLTSRPEWLKDLLKDQ